MRAIISGFGPFEGVNVNPTEVLVRRLLAEPPPGWELEGEVLPVSFERAPVVWDGLLERGGAADLLLALGVSGRATAFHLETRARARPEPTKARPDNDGARVDAVLPTVEPDLATSLDVDRVLAGLARRSSVPAEASTDAGAYVCERTYHHLLARGLERDTPALFVHVPTFEQIDESAQVAFLRELFTVLAAELSSQGRGD